MATGSTIAGRITSVDHVAIAVRDITSAARFFVDVLGGTMVFGGDNDVTGIRIVKLELAGFQIEIMQPLRDDSLLARHIERRGEGFHHLTFMVDDIAQTVTELAEAGLVAVGTDTNSDRWSETFLSPRETFGALLQFARASEDFGMNVDGYSLSDVLAGRVAWTDQIACLR